MYSFLNVLIYISCPVKYITVTITEIEAILRLKLNALMDSINYFKRLMVRIRTKGYIFGLFCQNIKTSTFGEEEDGCVSTKKAGQMDSTPLCLKRA